MQPPAGIDASCQLLRRLGYRLRNRVLENKGISKFLSGVFSGNTHEKCAGSTRASQWYILGKHKHIVPTICLWCCYIMVYVATNMFMVLQVVVQ